MALLLVILALFSFVGFGSISTGASVHASPTTQVPRHVLRRGPCGDPSWGIRGRDFKKPRPLRNCALRSAARP